MVHGAVKDDERQCCLRWLGMVVREKNIVRSLLRDSSLILDGSGCCIRFRRITIFDRSTSSSKCLSGMTIA